MAELIAERTFQRTDDASSVTVRIYAPKEDEGCWSAKVEIAGLTENFEEDVGGVDSFQALYLALHRACSRLEKVESILSFQQDNDANLPLVLPWTAGPALRAEVKNFARGKISTYLDSLPPAAGRTP